MFHCKQLGAFDTRTSRQISKLRTTPYFQTLFKFEYYRLSHTFIQTVLLLLLSYIHNFFFVLLLLFFIFYYFVTNLLDE